MRREPSDRAEMVNQLLLGDTFTIVEQREQWTLIRCDWDGYEGLFGTDAGLFQGLRAEAAARCLAANHTGQPGGECGGGPA